MINSIRAEFRKLTTVRSTYFITGLVILVAIFFGFYVFGIKANSLEAQNQFWIRDNVFLIFNNVGFFLGLIGILMFTHEYRYNMINYTLTSVRNRTRILVAKTLVISAFATFFFALLVGLSTVATMLGTSLSDVDFVTQNLDFGQLVWRGLFGAFGIAMFGLIIGGLVRNQVGAIVGFLVGPGALEGLLSLLLKSKATYLPFTALNQVIFAPGGETFNGTKLLSPGKSAIVVCVYIVVFWLLALWLLKRRDAN